MNGVCVCVCVCLSICLSRRLTGRSAVGGVHRPHSRGRDGDDGREQRPWRRRRRHVIGRRVAADANQRAVHRDTVSVNIT